MTHSRDSTSGVVRRGRHDRGRVQIEQELHCEEQEPQEDEDAERRAEKPGAAIPVHDVRATQPRFLGPSIDTLVGLEEIDRTVVVRVEDFQP